jgi:hypothetical protein
MGYSNIDDLKIVFKNSMANRFYGINCISFSESGFQILLDVLECSNINVSRYKLEQELRTILKHDIL